MLGWIVDSGRLPEPVLRAGIRAVCALRLRQERFRYSMDEPESGDETLWSIPVLFAYWSGGQRHIVNLSHGVDRATPVANFQAFIEAAKGTIQPAPSGINQAID